MTSSVTPWMSTLLHTHENMLVGGSSSSSLSELASASTQHRSSRHTRPPTRTSTVARSSSGPECSGREQVACSASSAQTHDMPAIRREPRRTRGQGETGRRHSRRGWPPFVRVRGLSKARSWRQKFGMGTQERISSNSFDASQFEEERINTDVH